MLIEQISALILTLDRIGTVLDGVTVFVVCYPFATSLLWSLSSLAYLGLPGRFQRGLEESLPGYSVLIPFHAEPDAALASARSLTGVSPAYDEILLIDDRSPTPLRPETVLPPRTRVLRREKRGGKAAALQTAFRHTRSEVIVCMDADTEALSSDWSGMLARFREPALGAVTGKIRPLRSRRLIQYLQQLDYLTVICLIKAAESKWGGLLTVSGAFSAFRRSALHDVGGWSVNSSTEDIDVSWRLQCRGWRLAYDRDWACRVEMAPSVGALWRQRRRWSSGLGHAVRDYGVSAVWDGARHLPIVVTVAASITWAIATILLGATSLAQATFGGEIAAASWLSPRIMLVLGFGYGLFVAQFACALLVDRLAFSAWMRLALLAPFYPLYFWFVLFPSFLTGFPQGFLRRDNGAWHRTPRFHEIEAIA